MTTATVTPMTMADFRANPGTLKGLALAHPHAVARRRFEYDRDGFQWPEVVVACLHLQDGPRAWVYPLQSVDVMAKCRTCLPDIIGGPETEQCGACFGTERAPLTFRGDLHWRFLDGQGPNNSHGVTDSGGLHWRVLPVEATNDD